MHKALHIAEGLTLPLDFAARTTAILAQKGVGKTYTGLRLTEELLAHDQQVVVLDPTGVWWGLRAPADAKHGRSFEVIVLGGEHADAPLEPTAGAIVATLAVESGRSLVLDLSGFESNAAQDRFATDFMETLYRAKAAARTTLHLMVDEADSFAPQRPMPGQQRMLGAAEAIVRRGRSRGLGITMISQRPAVLNKNVLTQADLLIALRIVGIQDHKALGDWASLYGTEEQRDEFVQSLPRLGIGEAWFWSPGWLQMFRRAKVSRRLTFDSSRTPDPSSRAPAPKIKAVDIASLSKEIAASVERAKAKDPTALRKRIAELEAELAKKPAAAAPPISFERLAAFDLELRAIEEEFRQAFEKFDHAKRWLADLVDVFGTGWNDAPDARAALKKMQSGLLRTSELVSIPGKKFPPNSPADRTPPPIRGGTPKAPPTGNGNQPAQPMAKAERAVLTVLAQYDLHDGRAVEKSRLALIAGYAVGGGGFNNSLSSLRSRGWIVGSDPITITGEGKNAIGAVPALPTGAALLEYWRNELPKAESTILYQLSHAPDITLTKEACALHAGYAANGGGFNNALSKLRTLKLITGKAKLTLAEELRP